MKELKGNRCSVCSNRMEQQQSGRRRKYCSVKCRNIYGNHKNANKPMLPAGLVKCVQCGNGFERIAGSRRECCSRICELAWGRRHEIEEIRRMAAEEKRQETPRTVRDFVLELYYNGYENRAITEALGLPKRRIKTWHEEYRRAESGNGPGSRKIKRQRYAFPQAQTALEWLTMLRERVSNRQYCVIDLSLESRSIFLVCGAFDIRKSVGSLDVIIQYELCMNPFDGDVFAFCGSKRNQIRYVYWDGSGFIVVRRLRERGTYPWPGLKFGKVIPVTSEEFGYILRGEGDFAKYPSYPIRWDCISLSGTF